MSPNSNAFALLRLQLSTRQNVCSQCRSLHRLNGVPLRVPKPSPFVPDTTTFLTLIGRSLSKHAASIPSWEALFNYTSEQFKEAGVEPARTRRYLMWWRERYRNGIFGIGGDLKHVKDGTAELRIVQVPLPAGAEDSAGSLNRDPGMRRWIINSKPGKEQGAAATDSSVVPPKVDIKDAIKARVAGVRIVGAYTVAGSGVEQVKGAKGVARLSVKEGLWEQKRGHKVDGGERRRAEVRSKRRAAERKNA